MKQLILTIIVLLAGLIPAAAQHGVAHITTHSREGELIGYILWVHDSSLTVLITNGEFEYPGWEAVDPRTGDYDTAVVAFSDITGLRIEKTSYSWLMLFPGLPLLLGGGAAVAAIDDSGNFSWGLLGGAVIGTAIGLPLAIIVAAIGNADDTLDITDPDDRENLPYYAIHP